MKHSFFLTSRPNHVPLWKTVICYLLVYCAVIGIIWRCLAVSSIQLNFQFVHQYRTRIWNGFLMTIEISAASLLLSLIIGVPVALGQQSRVLPVRALCSLYVTLIRGTPLIVQVYFFFYVLGTAWGIENREVAGILILSIFAGAYIAEIVRGSLLSLDKGQLEAALAVGFTHTQTVRYIIVPQLVSRTLPALTGQVASIIKDSSLLSVIAVIELTQTMREISATNYNFFGCFFLLGGLYLVLTLPLMLVSSCLEKRLAFEQ